LPEIPAEINKNEKTCYYIIDEIKSLKVLDYKIKNIHENPV